MVFLDPDNGIEIPSKRLGTKDSGKYVFWGEITRAYERGHSLVIYQHFIRESRDAYIARLAAQLAGRLQAPLVDSFRTANVVFFLVARPEHVAAFDRAHEVNVGKAFVVLLHSESEVIQPCRKHEGL